MNVISAIGRALRAALTDRRAVQLATTVHFGRRPARLQGRTRTWHRVEAARRARARRQQKDSRRANR